MLYVGIFLLVVYIIFAISVFVGVPFLPTNGPQAKKMIEFGNLKPGMKVVDLGSGAGRLLFLAAATGATAVGYELNPFLYWWTKVMIAVKGLKGKVEVRFKSIYDADLAGVDVAFAFLLPKIMRRLEPKFYGEMKPGTSVISYAFKMAEHQPVHKEQGIFVYKI